MADITVASALVWGFAMAIDAEMRPKYPTVVAWYERVLQQEGVKQAFGEKNFIEKRQAYEG
jgi:elongation factor 1-gamma